MYQVLLTISTANGEVDFLSEQMTWDEAIETEYQVRTTLCTALNECFTLEIVS